jgi:glycine cleavage system H protein
VGLTASAVEELGDVTFVELPSLGRLVTPGEAVCSIEAVKAACDFYCPIDGRIVAVNERLQAEPSLVNQSPENDGWIFALEDVSSEAVQALLDAKAHQVWEKGL